MVVALNHPLCPRLDAYLRHFDDCFANARTRAHLATYVAGQLSELPRKSVRTMAQAAGVPPRTLQEFLSLARWNHDGLRAHLQQLVVRDHMSPDSVGVISEVLWPKQGKKTPGVQRG